MYLSYVLNHSPDAAHSLESMGQARLLDGLSSERDKYRVNEPDHLLDNLSATWKRARISNEMIQFVIIISLATHNFCRVCESQDRWQDFSILWTDEDNLLGRPKS